MIGIILLILSIILYVTGRKRWSLLLFVSFVTRGLGFLTDEIIGIKNQDLAFVYIIVICVFSSLYEKKNIQEDKKLNCFIIAFFIFLICSVLFSYFYYEFTPYQILQGGRFHFLFLSYFFLRKTRKQDIMWLLRMLFYITLVHAVFYIIQVFTGSAVLPYYMGVRMNENTGLFRYYNYPHLLAFFLYLTLLFPFHNRIKNNIAAIVFIVALICTQGRTGIFITLVCLILGYLIRRKLHGFIRITLVLSIPLLIFSDVLLSRYVGGSTDEDIQAVLQGNFIQNVKMGYGNEGTLTFRFAWVYERAAYLAEQPFMENVFGLGMISDSQKELVNQRYHFTVGLVDEETGLPVQLGTADIAYGNMITMFGYLGGLLLLLIWIRLAYLFYIKRKVDGMVFCMFIFIISKILDSISSSYISTVGYLSIPFLLLPLLWKYDNSVIKSKSC